MSGRGLSEITKTEVQKQAITAAYLIKLEFDSGDVNAWTGLGNLQYSGDTYTGGGELIQLQPIRETIDTRAVGYQLGLSGIPSSLVSLALSEDYQGRSGTISMGFFHQNSASLRDNPIVLFRGQMDNMNILDTGKTAVITVNLESKMIRLRTPKESRYTHSEQLNRYPNDDSFKFVAQIANASIYWGDVEQSR